MSSYIIESNVPLPPKYRAPLKSKYPFEQLKVGQSFLVPMSESEGDIEKLKRRMDAARYAAQKVTGLKFVTRVEDNNGVRVWRAK